MKTLDHHIHSLTNGLFERVEEEYLRYERFSQIEYERFCEDPNDLLQSKFLLEKFVFGTFTQQPHEELIRSLYDLLQINMIDYARYAKKDQYVEIKYRDQTAIEPPFVEYRPISFTEWLMAFSTSLILRDPFGQAELLLQLEETDIRTFDGSDNTGGSNDIRRVMFRFIKAFFIDDDDVPISQRIQDVVTYSAPEFVGERFAQDYVNYLELPLAELLVSIHQQDREEKYPQKLLQALEKHKAYYTKVTNNGVATPSLVSLFITGLACHAYDSRGLEPTIETEYMPLWLVKGEFPSYGDAFPEFKNLPDPEAKNFMFTAVCEELEDWGEVVEACIKWGKEEINLPPMCKVIGRSVESEVVTKRLQGETFVDVYGNEPPELRFYSMESSDIRDPEMWLQEMKQKWQDHIFSLIPNAKVDAYFVD